MGRLALIPRTELGLLALIVLNLLLGLSLGGRGLIGWGVGGLAVWCAIASWRSRGARAGSPARPGSRGARAGSPARPLPSV